MWEIVLYKVLVVLAVALWTVCTCLAMVAFLENMDVVTGIVFHAIVAIPFFVTILIRRPPLEDVD